MQNLHLKNLKNSNILDYLITELTKINIINQTIKEFKDVYLDDIKQYKKIAKIPTNDLQKIKNNILEFNKIKNITIGSTIEANNYDYNLDYDEDLDKFVNNLILIEYKPINNKLNDLCFLELEVIENTITNITGYY
jgi:hypothetical protein